MKPIKIVSLGSGTADNITLRAFEALKRSDIIYAPDGKAISMLEELQPFESQLMSRVIPFTIPMQKDRSQATRLYHTITQQLTSDQQRGADASLVTIGDCGIYSSAFKIVGELKELGHPVTIISGVPSFVAGMSRVELPLVEQGQNLLILSSVSSIEDILQPLEQGCVVVIMKLSLYDGLVKKVLMQIPYSFVYIEHLGESEEYCTTELSKYLHHTCPYLSFIVIKPKAS